MSNEPKKLTLKEFSRIFKDNKDASSSSKYCFLLGAGASVSSGIPSGKTLAEKWYEVIQEDADPEEFKKWKKKKNINENNLAASYSVIYEKRFRANRADGYAEIQNQLTGKPSVGYAFLAKILAETEHRFVITTNFDSLIEDALFIYTDKKPLVCGHESLAGYINVHGKRPTIIKIHRDVLLDPISDKKGTNKLKKQWEKALKPLVSGFHLVVIGYGGNDGSLMNYLNDLKDNRKPIYWCFREEDNISEQTNDILTENDYLVTIKGFDDLMVELRSVLGLTIDTEDFIKNAGRRKKEFEEELNEFVESKEKAKEDGEELPPAIKEIVPDWWEYQLRADAAKDDVDKQDAIYREGIKKLPNSYELIGSYAFFLHTIRNESDQAEIYYKKALELDPNHANNNGNYAIFLSDIRNESDQAEIYYKKALELDPNHANNNGNYAIFLSDICKEYDQAEIYYKKALELDSESALWNGNYASFLDTIRKEYDQAESYYKESLEFAPESALCNGNYALFLDKIRKKYDQAESYYKESLELDPNRASLNGNYALFLETIRNEYDQAESYYKKALKLDPNDAYRNGSYASFLHTIRKEYDQAEIYYKKALEFNPNDANNNGSYGGLLLGMGRKEEANLYIEKAFDLISETPDEVLELELWFYKLAHYPEQYEEAKTNIDRLLNKNIRSIGWDFSKNIEQAAKEGHLHLDELKEYARRITSK